jgi:hypothetical protein
LPLHLTPVCVFFVDLSSHESFNREAQMRLCALLAFASLLLPSVAAGTCPDCYYNSQNARVCNAYTCEGTVRSPDLGCSGLYQTANVGCGNGAIYFCCVCPAGTVDTGCVPAAAFLRACGGIALLPARIQ